MSELTFWLLVLATWLPAGVVAGLLYRGFREWVCEAPSAGEEQKEEREKINVILLFGWISLAALVAMGLHAAIFAVLELPYCAYLLFVGVGSRARDFIARIEPPEKPKTAK